MDDVEQLRTRIAAAERRIRWLTAVTVVLGGALVVAAAGPDPTEDVVRTRGLVVVDEQGRERAVVGAPMAVVSEDPKLAETVGLAVKDTAGRLHVVVGARNPAVTPDGEVAERIAPGVGMTVYDPETGQERGGFGVLADGRANVCLDYRSELREAACMGVSPDDRYAAFVLTGTPGEEAENRATMYVGADGSGAVEVLGGGGNEAGVVIRAGEGRLPTATVYDSAGADVGDLVRPVAGGGE